MKTVSPVSPVGRKPGTIAEFIERLDAIAVAALPIKGDETHSRHRVAVRYYRLEVGDFVESPWVTVTDGPDGITATVSGDDKAALNTPEAALEALKADCRSRLIDAGIDPAF